MSDQNESVEYFPHTPVLLKECIFHLMPSSEADNLPGKNNFTMADLTFGGGGHSFSFLELNSQLRIMGVDQDPDSIINAKKIITEKKLDERIRLYSMNFLDFTNLSEWNENFCGFDAILLDLGVSSHQFDSEKRGFSFRYESPLDMRMNYHDEDSNLFLTASEIINETEEKELADIFFQYGEERYSRRIARKIVEIRKFSPIKSTTELAKIIISCYPKAKKAFRTHPATKCFQALRIAVNKELEILENVIPKLIQLLSSNGKIGIISYHSLEDRIVKHQFKKIVQNDPNIGKIITKRPIIPTDMEIEKNPRSRSAKLRVFEKN
jgi:16S rRNA (cytosine1402-N4)-methyltransferase